MLLLGLVPAHLGAGLQAHLLLPDMVQVHLGLGLKAQLLLPDMGQAHLGVGLKAQLPLQGTMYQQVGLNTQPLPVEQKLEVTQGNQSEQI